MLAGWRVTGFSAEAIQQFLPEAERAGFQLRCRCKVKMAIVPSDRLRERKEAEKAGLFGWDTV
eukprot:2529626-Alexandrium_andersonii.AAC.1